MVGRVEGGLGLVKTTHKENGSSESHLDSHMPFPVNTSPNNMHSMQEMVAYQGRRF